MTNETTDRLEAATARRREVASRTERIKGRLEEAQTNLAAVEQQCRDRKIDPDRIDEAVEKLHKRYEKAVSAIENDLSRVEDSIRPYESR
jgi:predicted nuclease with TOPRIM domain